MCVESLRDPKQIGIQALAAPLSTLLIVVIVVAAEAKFIEQVFLRGGAAAVSI